MPTTARLRRSLLGLTLGSMIAACSGAASSAPAPTAAVARTAPPAGPPRRRRRRELDRCVARRRAPRRGPAPRDPREHRGGDVQPPARCAGRRPGPTSSPPRPTVHDRVEDLRAERGFAGTRRSRSTGAWRLPTVGLDPRPGRRVGRWLDDRARRGGRRRAARPDDQPLRDPRSRRSRPQPRIVELVGAFEFDALSPDGSLLYVVEHLPGPPAGHYQVRAVETATGTLRPDVVVDKLRLGRGDGRLADRAGPALRRPGLHPVSRRGAPVHPRPQQRRRRGPSASTCRRPAPTTPPRRSTGAWPPRRAGRTSWRSTRRSDSPSRSTRATSPSVARPRSSRSAARGIVLAKFGHQADGTGRSTGRGRARRFVASTPRARAASSGSMRQTCASARASSRVGGRRHGA